MSNNLDDSRVRAYCAFAVGAGGRMFGHFYSPSFLSSFFHCLGAGWSSGAMVPGKLPVLGRPTVWMIVGQGPIALVVGASGSCLDIFTLLYPFSPLSPSLWETTQYKLKYCLKGR